MFIDVFRTRSFAVTSTLAAAALFAFVHPLAAQSAQPAAVVTSSDETAQTTSAQVPPRVNTSPNPAPRSSNFELVGGYEGDSHHTGYGFLGPHYIHRLNDDVKLIAHIHFTHLTYAFANGLGGTTEVTAPGISPAIGLRIGQKNWVQFSTGLDVKREQRDITNRAGLLSSNRETKVGMSLGADGWWNPSRRSNVHAMVNYGSASKYTWGRVAAKHQVSNFDWQAPVTFYLGAEGIGQGNQDITSWQGGGLLEMLIHRSELSLMARGGYKRSTFNVGPDKTGPYFGVGLWKRF
jgi:hypothetical protein